MGYWLSLVQLWVVRRSDCIFVVVSSRKVPEKANLIHVMYFCLPIIMLLTYSGWLAHTSKRVLISNRLKNRIYPNFVLKQNNGGNCCPNDLRS